MAVMDASGLDRWTLPTWGTELRTWRLSDWVVDPLERAMLVAVVVLGAVLLWLASAEEPAGSPTARDACVLTAVEEARAFATVMGDHRVIPASFALRSCARQLG